MVLQMRPALCRDGRGDGRVRRCSMVCVAEVAEERRKQTAEQEQPQQKALEAKKEPTRARLEQRERQRQVCCDQFGARNPLHEQELKKRPELEALMMEMLWMPVAAVQKALCSTHGQRSRRLVPTSPEARSA